jgi:hypothetical protein
MFLLGSLPELTSRRRPLSRRHRSFLVLRRLQLWFAVSVNCMNPRGRPLRLVKVGSGLVGSAGGKDARGADGPLPKASRTLDGRQMTCVRWAKLGPARRVCLVITCFEPRLVTGTRPRLASRLSLEFRTGARAVALPGRKRSFNVTMRSADVWDAIFVGSSLSLSLPLLKDFTAGVITAVTGRSSGPRRSGGVTRMGLGTQRALRKIFHPMRCTGIRAA